MCDAALVSGLSAKRAVLFTRAEGLYIVRSYNQIDFNKEIVPICVF